MGYALALRTKYCLLSVFFTFSGLAWGGEWYYGFGEDPEDAMKEAVYTAKRDSPARCLGKDNKPDIEKHCEYAGDGFSYFDDNDKRLGSFRCRAEGSNNRGSCE